MLEFRWDNIKLKLYSRDKTARPSKLSTNNTVRRGRRLKPFYIHENYKNAIHYAKKTMEHDTCEVKLELQDTIVE